MQRFTLDEEERLNDIAMTHGGAMAMMIRHERQVLSQPERMPGLRSSFLCTCLMIQPWKATWTVWTSWNLRMCLTAMLSFRVPVLTNYTWDSSIDSCGLIRISIHNIFKPAWFLKKSSETIKVYSPKRSLEYFHHIINACTVLNFLLLFINRTDRGH